MSGKSPRTEPQQLPAPESFSRPINAANSYAPFDKIKVLDMDDLYDSKFPKMPMVLTTHDIFPDDWKRCIQVRNLLNFFFSALLSHQLLYLSFRIYLALGPATFLLEAWAEMDGLQSQQNSQLN